MKTTLLSLAAAFVLLTATAASAASISRQDGPRTDNYGYDRNHRVTPQERAQWEAQHRNDRHDDKNDRHDGKNDRHDDKNGHYEVKNDRRDDKNDHRDNDHRNDNYGYDRNHRVTPQERAKWEAEHRNDHR